MELRGKTKSFICVLISSLVLTVLFHTSGRNLHSYIPNSFQLQLQAYLSENVSGSWIDTEQQGDFFGYNTNVRHTEDDTLRMKPFKPLPVYQRKTISNITDLSINKIPFTKNLSKCISTPNTGPIRRNIDIVARTKTESKCEVFREGLLHASVGIEAKITIKVDLSLNKTIHTKHFFSILAVGEQNIFAISPSSVSRNPFEVHFSYTPTIPGDYQLYVEEISRSSQKQLPGSPFTLIINGSAIDVNERVKEANRLPSCQTIQQHDPSWLDGDWVTRDLAGDERGTLRSGWVLQPRRCSFDIFTTDDLERASLSSVSSTIVVLGRSTERGIFLSLVDLALRKKEKTNLKDSVLWRCWGMEEVRIGNLRFIYQDFRIEGASMKHMNDSTHINITCHNDTKVSDNNDFFGDAIGFFQETLFTEKIQPDVVIMVVLNDLQLEILEKTIPPLWNGTFYALNGFKAHEGSLYTPNGKETDAESANSFTLDKRIRNLNGFKLATPWRHTTEKAPFIMKSMHWHKPCNDMNGKIKVCSNPTEMIAQILLGMAIAPDGKDAWLVSLKNCESTTRNVSRKIRFCHDCPKSLFPWHIKRVPNLKCTTLKGSLPNVAKKDQQAWKGSLCPKHCMASNPVGKYDTQSGSVDVRICTILKIDDTL
ncbi:uncharacterized protein [Apostichopus japonicus]|uniref:uncharacterized protein n=1 Tax=Stichopus japonicus TaxID=307972 RepID=UPI003AB23F36